MLPHISDHSRLVCRVAHCLAKLLIENQVLLNLELVQAGALLHDITKTRSLLTGESHPHSGCDLLAALGYPEVGKVVAQHVKLHLYFKNDHPDEAEIVNYADKRVINDRIVSLERRMQYILEHYAKTTRDAVHVKTLCQLTEQVEQRIFAHIDFPPQDLEHQLGRHISWADEG
jgi:putative nucleotidyltransferase with HDIG domain